MSTLSVEVKKILDVQKHPNADRLDLVQIDGWWCVTGKGNFKTGDLCIYLPVDSVLPQNLETFLFPPGSKITLKNSRIKSTRIRQVFSQGMALPVDDIVNAGFLVTVPLNKLKEGLDITSDLGITKFTPTAGPPSLRGGKIKKKIYVNENFHKYTDIEHIRKFLSWFKPEDEVVAREKIHGTNYRVGYAKNVANTWWKKGLKYFGFLPEYEFCFGSRNLQLTLNTHKSIMNGNPWVPKNAYERITVEYNMKKLLKPGEVLYGEIYGPNVQTNYHYGLSDGELGFVAFDVEVNGQYLSDAELEEWCTIRNIPLSPVIYRGTFNIGAIVKLNNGNSRMSPSQPTMEGVVIRPVTEYKDARGRKIGKLISEEYALKDDDEVTEYQ